MDFYDNYGSFGAIDFIVLFFTALVFVYCWRFLIRLSHKRTFCFWYPTMMLVIAALLYWAGENIANRSSLGSFLEYVEIAWIGLNLPIIMAVFTCLWVLSKLGLWTVLPAWIPFVLTGILFWLFWYHLLKYLRIRELQKFPLCLNLNDKNRESGPE